jgi:signal transduction histidine kinase
MSRANILIIDDQPRNIGVLFNFLRSYKYNVLVANDAESALHILSKETCPDVILLDVMMPGMNGFDLCRKLKADPKTHSIPVIFMSALHDTASKLEGFSVGAVDYIIKPFEQEEVLARIKSQVTIHQLQRELQAKNKELDAFAYTIAHDLKNSLQTITNSADMLRVLSQERLDNEEQEELDTIHNTAAKTSDILEALLLLADSSKHEALVQEVLMMEYIVPKALDRLRNKIAQTHAEIITPDSWPAVKGYAPWIEEIWVNYLSNALKYGGTPPQIELGAELDSPNQQVKFWVKDNGPGLDQTQRDKLFIPFSRLDATHEEGHGLGLAIVQQIAEKLRGSVSIESEPGAGSRFIFTLPAAPEKS